MFPQFRSFLLLMTGYRLRIEDTFFFGSQAELNLCWIKTFDLKLICYLPDILKALQEL